MTGSSLIEAGDHDRAAFNDDVGFLQIAVLYQLQAFARDESPAAAKFSVTAGTTQRRRLFVSPGSW